MVRSGRNDGLSDLCRRVPWRRPAPACRDAGSGVVLTRGLRAALLLALLSLALSTSACGGSDSGSRSSGTGGPSGLAGKEPKAILNAVVAALKDVHSYHIEGSGDDEDGHTEFSGDIAGNGTAQIKFDTPGGVLEVIAVGQLMFLKGDKAVWAKQGKRQAELLADRWVEAPAESQAGLRDALAGLLPSHLARCATQNVGTLTRAGTASVDGKKTVVLVDKGDTPGGTPGKLYVATEGAALPLRLQQTGAHKPGGTSDPNCDGADSTTTGFDAKLSRFNEQFDIKAPADPLDLDELQNDQGAGL